jgi:hypothetical protein
MATGKTDCEHRCRNTCAMLNDALQDEKKKIAYYESMLNDCDDPGVRTFTKELLEAHSLLVSRISQKISEIGSNAEVLDNIIDGFES